MGTTSKHANNLGFCAKNSKLAHHFFVYLFYFFLKFSISCAGGKKAAWRKSKSCAREIRKKWPKTQTGAQLTSSFVNTIRFLILSSPGLFQNSDFAILSF